MLARMVRFVVWAVAFGWIAWLLKKQFEARAIGNRPRGDSRVPPAGPRPAVRLERDPCCGTYVSPEISFSLEHHAQETRVMHFCSAECRARFLQLEQRAAS
jgi:YHS domain-containing protein